MSRYKEEADSFSIERRECLSPYAESRQTPSLERGESVSLLEIEKADSSSIESRESLSYT